MNKESIAIIGIGIRTADICNVDDLYDQLLECSELQKKQIILNNSVQEAIEEAKALGQPRIHVNVSDSSSVSFYQALEQAWQMEHAVIICTQKNEKNQIEAAVLYTSMVKEDKAWAVITKINQEEGTPSVFSKRYKNAGPVQEAGGIIAACIALYYGLTYSKSKRKEGYLKDWESEAYKVSIQGGQVVLERAEKRHTTTISGSSYLVPVSFETVEEAKDKLEHLLALSKRLSLEDLSSNTRKGFFESQRERRTVVFAAKKEEELRHEVKAFLGVQSKWDHTGYVWRTKAGSFYTATLLPKDAKVVIINPPMGMLSERHFYRLYRALPKLERYVKDSIFNRESKNSWIRRCMFECLSRQLLVQALQELGISFHIAAGAGIGEAYLPYILGIIKNENVFLNSIDKLIESQQNLEKGYFSTIPRGEMEKWYLVCDKDCVLDAIEDVGEGEVFLIIVGSATDVMICGRSIACERVMARLGAYGIKLDATMYLHTPVLKAWAKMESSRLEEVEIQLKGEQEYELFSGVLQEKLDGSFQMFAKTFIESICKPVDMPMLFDKLYQQGCRVFLDLSSGRLCNKWMREKFWAKTDILITSLFEETNPADSLSLLLAQFMSYGVSVDYERFYQALNWKQERSDDIRTQLMEQLMDCNRQPFSRYRSMEKGIMKNKEGELEPFRITELSEHKSWRINSHIYRSQEIIEMTEGSMANVFGNQYLEVDQYPVRARLPLPPYLFVSRITGIAASYRKFEEGGYIEGEFDITKDTLLLINQQVISNSMLIETGQIGIALAAYMGIDAEWEGMRRFLITDETQEYYGEDWPKVGNTIRLRYCIDHIATNKGQTVLYCTYDIRLFGKPLMQLKQIGGFFERGSQSLAEGIKENEKPEVMLTERCPLYHPITGRHQFSKEKMYSFLQGRLTDCFGEQMRGVPLMYWTGEYSLLVDQILDISSEGGSYGYGYIYGEKEINESFWPFAVHFKNEPILPNTIMMEMVNQVMAFFECYMGLHNTAREEIPVLVKNHPNRTRFAGEIQPGTHILIIKAEPRVVKAIQNKVLIIYDSYVYCDELLVVKQDGVAYFIS